MTNHCCELSICGKVVHSHFPHSPHLRLNRGIVKWKLKAVGRFCDIGEALYISEEQSRKLLWQSCL